MTSIGSSPVIPERADGQAAAVTGKRNTSSTPIISSLTINISTDLRPDSIAVFVDPGVTSRAFSPVILVRTDGQAAAVSGKRHTYSTLIISSLTINISTDLRPDSIAVFVDPGVTSIGSSPVIPVRADGQAAAVSGKRHTPSTPITSSLTINISTDLRPDSIAVFVDPGVTSRASSPVIPDRADGQAAAVTGKRNTSSTLIKSSLTINISTDLRPDSIAVFVDPGVTSRASSRAIPVRADGQAAAVTGKRHTSSTPIISSLTINISTDLRPDSIAVFVDPGVTSIECSTIIEDRADGQAAAVSGKRHTYSTEITSSLTINISTDLRPDSIAVFVDPGVTSIACSTIIPDRPDGQAAAVSGKRRTPSTLIISSLTINIIAELPNRNPTCNHRESVTKNCGRTKVCGGIATISAHGLKHRCPSSGVLAL